MLAKSVLGLLDAGITPDEIVRRGIAFGTRYRDTGWGAGLTVLVAMANVLPSLAPDDRALALGHGRAHFLAAYTPTRRELVCVVDIGTRLRGGEDLIEAE